MSRSDEVQAHQPEEPLRLNLGAAKTYIPGFVNIDIDQKAELTLDLGADRLPFPDDSVDVVVSRHTLEHVPNYLFALSEIHRVMRHDGELLLSLPYVTRTEHHLVNPYHLHNFSERSFDFFDPSVMKGSAGEESETAFRKVFVRFNYNGYFLQEAANLLSPTNWSVYAGLPLIINGQYTWTRPMFGPQRSYRLVK